MSRTFSLIIISVSLLFYLYPNRKIGINFESGNYDYYLILHPNETFVGDLSSIKNIQCINYIEIRKPLYNYWEPRLLRRNHKQCNESYNYNRIYIIGNTTETYGDSDLQLGRKYEHLNDTKKAKIHYQKAVKSIANDPETFYALYRLAVLDMKEALFLKAYHYYPHRKEPLYYLARFARTRNNFTECLLYARSGLLVGSPSIYELYVENAIYLYALEEEFAYCLYYSGRVNEANGIYESRKLNPGKN